MMKKNVVGAGYGFKDWLLQRVTAVVMAVYVVAIAIALIAAQPGTFEAWRAFFACGIVKFGTFLFALSLFYHAWVGIRDLWMDYVQADGLRLFLHSLTALLLIGYAAWFSAILWRL